MLKIWGLSIKSHEIIMTDYSVKHWTHFCENHQSSEHSSTNIVNYPQVHKKWNTRWNLQMETSSMLLALCEGNSPVTGEFPSQRPVAWSFDVFFDLCQNKRLSKQSRNMWFEMPSHPLWRHCNELSGDTKKSQDLLSDIRSAKGI